MGAEPDECVPERPARQRRAAWREWAPLTLLTVAALVGGGLWLAGLRTVPQLIWAAVTLVALVPAAWATLRQLWRRQFGVDVIAVLALVGTLLVREYLAGAVIAVMVSTGQALEGYAQRRASRDLRALPRCGPCSAHQGGSEDPRGRATRPERAIDRGNLPPGSGDNQAGTQRTTVAAGLAETINACGVDVRPEQPSADRGEAGTHPGVARSARSAEGIPAVHGGGGSQWNVLPGRHGSTLRTAGSSWYRWTG